MIERLKASIGKIETKEDFIEFLRLLSVDCKTSKWENNNLESYLGAMIAWTEDMDRYYRNNNLPLPSNANWKLFADILIAATMYE